MNKINKTLIPIAYPYKIVNVEISIFDQLKVLKEYFEVIKDKDVIFDKKIDYVEVLSLIFNKIQERWGIQISNIIINVNNNSKSVNFIDPIIFIEALQEYVRYIYEECSTNKSLIGFSDFDFKVFENTMIEAYNICEYLFDYFVEKEIESFTQN